MVPVMEFHSAQVNYCEDILWFHLQSHGKWTGWVCLSYWLIELPTAAMAYPQQINQSHDVVVYQIKELKIGPLSNGIIRSKAPVVLSSTDVEISIKGLQSLTQYSLWANAGALSSYRLRSHLASSAERFMYSRMLRYLKWYFCRFSKKRGVCFLDSFNAHHWWLTFT